MRPVTLPSLVAASVSFCHWSRPWWPDTRDSERVSVYLQGLLIRRETHQVIHSSGVVCSLPPKPPPTSGAITRILDSGTPVVAASRNRVMCGIWVADHIVICSPVGSTTVERGSMNAGISRCWRYSRSMTMPSLRASSSTSSIARPLPCPPESSCQNADLLVPRAGCASTVSAAAASLRSSAAGSSSYSTSTSSAASRASAAVRAATTATISPANATRSTAIGRWSGVTWSVVIGQALAFTPWVSARSFPVKTSTTLVIALAAAVSMLLMVACASGLRTMARWSIPGRVMLSVQRVRPVISRWSSLRRRSRPISSSGAGASWTAVMPALLRSRRCAQRRTARP